MPEGSKRKADGSSSSRGKKIRVGASRETARGADTPNTTASTSQTGLVRVTLKDRVIDILKSPSFKESGISSTQLESQLDGVSQDDIAKVLNELLRVSRVKVERTSNNSNNNNNSGYVYTIIDEEEQIKREGLDAHQLLVLQAVEGSGNQGIWTKEVRMRTGIQQQTLNKIFRQLEQRQLIKPVKDVTAKWKKLYMKFDLDPSKEMTGGVWYSGLEMDEEFVSNIRECIQSYIQNQSNKKGGGSDGVTIDEIHNFIQVKEISKVELTKEDVEQVVKTLVYDRSVEEQLTRTQVQRSTGRGTTVQTIVRYIPRTNVLSNVNFQWWDCLDDDFHFRSIVFEDGLRLPAHEHHYHT